jgi:predicted 3-demethylubiquinone-9 3-methyltransferase (glyoxalase superfamily)
LITPWLWFDTEAEEAAQFYVSLFDRSRVLDVTRYTEAGPGPAGSVMTVTFELDGQQLIALNGGPQFPFTEAVSFQVPCETQADVDRYWAAFTDGGQEGQCGWVRDRFGLWWQVVPTALPALVSDPERGKDVVRVMLRMRKLDIAALEDAAEGAAPRP